MQSSGDSSVPPAINSENYVPSPDNKVDLEKGQT